ncbi:MAG: trypsin-like peptidase domain-containing protein [Ginsengibacter sp.]
MKAKNVFFTVLISALTAVGVLFGYNYYNHNNNNPNFQNSQIPSNYKYAGLFDSNGNPSPGPADFTQAAAAAIPTVVHIKTKTNPRKANNNLPQQRNPFSDLFGDNDMFDQLFGQRQRSMPQMASGSGVIISDDGYIITNNHVVAGADELMVTLANRKTYTAKVVGADPSYDLAVIKIDAKNLPFMLYGNSADVQIGQWVLAIGYPLNLDATVTAGIISAKSRSLGLNRDKSGKKDYAVESYLQTDAAVNMGNSGGALINTNGQLIGINSAIASPTGYYNGYSYAIPVDIVKKVINDLIKYGSVQRGFLGAIYVDAGDPNVTDQQKTASKIPLDVNGIYITDLVKGGAAMEGGMKAGDILRKVNNVAIGSSSELQEQLSNFRPGDKIQITYDRAGKTYTTQVTLKNNAGNFDIVKRDEMIDKLGAELVTLDEKKAKELGVAGGVVVRKINEGAINDQTRMRDGFIITQANGKDVKSIDDLKKIIGTQNSVTISGIYPGYSEPFEYPLDLSSNSDQ